MGRGTWDMGHGTWDMVAIVVLSPNQSKFFETVAYIKSYEQNRFLPNQTKPTQNLPKPSKMGALATWSLNQLKFSKLVAYIKSYEQKHFSPNQTKPNRPNTKPKLRKISSHNIWINFCLLKYA